MRPVLLILDPWRHCWASGSLTMLSCSSWSLTSWARSCSPPSIVPPPRNKDISIRKKTFATWLYLGVSLSHDFLKSLAPLHIILVASREKCSLCSSNFCLDWDWVRGLLIASPLNTFVSWLLSGLNSDAQRLFFSSKRVLAYTKRYKTCSTRFVPLPIWVLSSHLYCDSLLGLSYLVVIRGFKGL